MAMKQVFVSDLDGTELTDGTAARITVKLNGSAYVVDAGKDDATVKLLIEKGRKQAVRGRKSK